MDGDGVEQAAGQADQAAEDGGRHGQKQGVHHAAQVEGGVPDPQERHVLSECENAFHGLHLGLDKL